MIQANISTIKNNISQFIEKVACGDEVVISDRDKPVAMLIPFTPSQVRGNWSARVAQLSKLGQLKRPRLESNRVADIDPIESIGGSQLSDLLLEERGAGR
ncbi:type II toxin-antitoxin system prevent-host-death family antitoxin [bacterium]|jgi:prevent-host-death family protein|nr:type II toxin-antitoxin system prevent-host-death family antitoxin [bacterium]